MRIFLYNETSKALICKSPPTNLFPLILLLHILYLFYYFLLQRRAHRSVAGLKYTAWAPIYSWPAAIVAWSLHAPASTLGPIIFYLLWRCWIQLTKQINYRRQKQVLIWLDNFVFARFTIWPRDCQESVNCAYKPHFCDSHQCHVN